MLVEIRKQSQYEWAVYVDGIRTVDRESYQVASNVAYYLEHPETSDFTESAEVASSILTHMRGNTA